MASYLNPDDWRGLMPNEFQTGVPVPDSTLWPLESGLTGGYGPGGAGWAGELYEQSLAEGEYGEVGAVEDSGLLGSVIDLAFFLGGVAAGVFVVGPWLKQRGYDVIPPGFVRRG